MYPIGYIFKRIILFCTRKGVYLIILPIFVPEKERRKQLRLTQPELAMRAGVGLRFVRELEQGKKTLRLDKVNQVLALFGAEVGVVTLVEE